MELKNNPFKDEIYETLMSGKYKAKIYYYAKITANNKVINPITLVSMDDLKDYVNNFSDTKFIELTLGMGDYMFDVAPYFDNLTITVIKNKRYLESPDSSVLQDETIEKTYTANILGANQEYLPAQQNTLIKREAANLTGFATIRFQLKEKAVEEFRLMSFGTSFRQVNPGKCVEAVITQESKKIKVDEDNKILGVRMATPDNQEIFDHVIIEHATPLLNIPDYVHARAGGIYNAGLGFYYNRNYWYIWPIYDLSRHETKKKTITIIIVPPNLLNSVETTYRETASQLIIIATGKTAHLNISEREYLNQGNGVRFVDSRQIMDGFVTVDGNKATASRVTNTSEFLSYEREQKDNYARKAPINSTRNHYYESSKMATRQGTQILLTWQHANPDLLIPDTPVYVYYQNGDMPGKLKATLLGAQTHVKNSQPGVTNPMHITNCVLRLFAEKYNNDLPQTE